MTFKELFKDRDKKSYVSAIISFGLTLAFSIYNGFLGVYKHSIWNGSICVYYLLLITLRFVVLMWENKIKNLDNAKKDVSRYKLAILSTILLFVLNVSLVVPITLLVLNQKEISFGLIPAIVFATYTTYKIVMAILNYKKDFHNKNFSIRILKTINIIDAIVSILTLQNMLIVVNSGQNQDMLILSSISSFVAIVVMLVLTITTFLAIKKEYKLSNQNKENTKII